jgi:putative membrane protein
MERVSPPGRSLALAAAVAVAAVLPACGRGEDARSAAAALSETAAEATAAAATADLDEWPAANTAPGLLARLAVSDRFEIVSGEMVQERTRNADVRRFAQLMVQDHTRTSNEAQATARAEAIDAAPPAGLDGRRQAMLEQLQAVNGADLDARYVDQQVDAHEEALKLLRDYAAGGDNAALKAWAARTAPMIENHLQMARAMDEADVGRSPGATGSNP